MNREKQLVKNTLILSIGTFLARFTSIITLPILTAFLSKRDYGVYDLLITLVSLVLPTITLKIDMGIFRFLIDCRGNIRKIQKLITTAYFFIIPMSLIVSFMAFYFIKASPLTKILIALYFFSEAIWGLTLQIIRGLSKNFFYSIASISNSIISMILIVLLISKLRQGINGLLIAIILGQLTTVCFLFIITKLYKYISIHLFSILELKMVLSYSWPLVPNSLSFWVMNLSDRLIISTILGLEANAVYAVANKIPQLFSSMQGAFVAAWQENAALYVSDEDVEEYYSKMFDAIFRLLSGIMALLIAITPFIFWLLVKGDYDIAYYQMPILFLGMLFLALSSFLGGIYTAHKKTKNVGITTIIAAILNFIINMIFIKNIGLYAASVSTTISYFFLCIYRMIDIKSIQKIKYNIEKIILIIFILICMCVLCSTKDTKMLLLNAGIGILFSISINKNIVKTILVHILGR